MPRPQATDGRNGLKIWRVVVNILICSRGQGWSSSLGGWASMLRNDTEPQTRMDYLEEPKESKMDTRFGTSEIKDTG
jgi:hypothetical protein